MLPERGELHFHVVRYPIVDPAGAVTGLGAVSVDVTAVKRAERELRESEQRLREAQALARFGSWELDPQVGRLRWSEELCRICGRPPGFSPTFEEFLALVHPEDRDALRARVDHAWAGEFGESVYRIVRPDGEIRHVHTRRYGRTDETGSVRQLWGATQDITDQTLAERELRAERERSRAIITAMSEGYALTVGGEIVEVNDALCQLTGFDRSELVGSRAPFPFWAPEARAGTLRLRDAIVAREGGTFELAAMRRDGSRFDAELTARPARNPDGTVLGFVTTMRDVTVKKRHQVELERLATTDPLTGLLNHRTFRQRLAAEIARAKRHRRPLSLVILDLDFFKDINDRHGHPVGDQVLREAAARLRQLSREGEHLARIGGEEFAWILPDATADGAYAAAERARHAISATPFPTVGTITLSAGVCALADAGGPTQLYTQADEALYVAKHQGRDQTVRWHAAQTAPRRQRGSAERQRRVSPG